MDSQTRPVCQWAGAGSRRGVAALLLLASGAIGCSNDAAGPNRSSVDALVAAEWELIFIRQEGQSLRPFDAFTPRVVFTKEASPAVDGYLVVAGGGCNGMGGAWRSADPDELEIRALAFTEKFCLPVGVNAFETRFFDALAGSRGFRVDDDRLVLSFEGGVLTFRRGSSELVLR